MGKKLKAVIFSIENVLLTIGSKPNTSKELEKLVVYLLSRAIRVVFFTNRDLTVTVDDTETPFQNFAQAKWPSVLYVSKSTHPDMPGKPQTTATLYLLNLLALEPNECVYVGSSNNDMKTAVNGNLLFLRAAWYEDETDYGFEFASPRDITRFIDTFCLRDHLWCIEMNDERNRYYSLAPFSTFKPQYEIYSRSAKSALKNNIGHPEFWFYALVTSLYFSDLHKEIDYIAVVPGHDPERTVNIIDDVLEIFGNCFRKKYMPDLVLRHTKAVKSQTAKQLGLVADINNQLNTIYINRAPNRNASGPYRSYPARDKTVLLADDFCTKGDSLAAAKLFLEKTGANVICVTWLKTINTDFEFIDQIEDFNPFAPNKFQHMPTKSRYRYHDNITDHLAPAEIDQALNAFINWDWT